MLNEQENQQTLGIQEIFAGQSLKDKWNDPGSDPRTPDIILKVNTGVIFTGGSKIAEHGGLNEDDIHAALLVSFLGHAENRKGRGAEPTGRANDHQSAWLRPQRTGSREGGTNPRASVLV